MSAPPLPTLQAEFAAALLARDAGARPDFLSGEAAERFRVYRNNVFHGLSEALGDAYPVVRRLVGEAFFRAMAGEYLVLHPPRSRTLALFGAEFPRFVGRFPPAASVPYLGDVARLERAHLEARHAEDAPPIDPDAVAALGPAAVTARFVAHPAARLVASEYPIAEIWRANQPDADGTPAQPLRMGRGGALVTRPRYETHVRALGAAETAFAQVLLRGDDTATAFAAAALVEPGFDLAAAFRALLAAGAFQAIQPTDATASSLKR